MTDGQQLDGTIERRHRNKCAVGRSDCRQKTETGINFFAKDELYGCVGPDFGRCRARINLIRSLDAWIQAAEISEFVRSQLQY